MKLSVYHQDALLTSRDETDSQDLRVFLQLGDASADTDSVVVSWKDEGLPCADTFLVQTAEGFRIVVDGGDAPATVYHATLAVPGDGVLIDERSDQWHLCRMRFGDYSDEADKVLSPPFVCHIQCRRRQCCSRLRRRDQ